MRIGFVAILLLAGIGGSVLAQDQPDATAVPVGPTLNSVLSRGELVCGVDQDLFGFGYLDPNSGEVSGFDVDFCRAVAAAIFGSGTAVRFELYSSASAAAAALADGTVDLLVRNAVWSLSSDAAGLRYGPVNFYGGQSIVVEASSGIQDWEQLSGRTICVVQDGVAASELPGYLSRVGVTAQILTEPTLDAAWQAFLDGRCEAQTADRVLLEIYRQRSDDPAAFIVWDRTSQIYTREPYAPLFRAGDEQWADIVRWTVLGLMAAEQVGISSENVGLVVRQATPAGTQEDDQTYVVRVGIEVARMLDERLGIGAALGLAPNFMLPVIRDVGNYGEIYQRHLGPDSDLPIERGLNELWTKGGLIYAPSWR
jgi:general L-amino acid transport system substrate-binding protein